MTLEKELLEKIVEKKKQYLIEHKNAYSTFSHLSESGKESMRTRDFFE